VGSIQGPSIASERFLDNAGERGENVATEQHRRASSMKGTRLRVSPNGRYLVKDAGDPFFYLADTAWTLFKRLIPEEADRYFANRVAKGFTAIQAYVLRGLEVPNLEGHVPLVDRDPTRLNEGFFSNVDRIVGLGNEAGLVMGLVASMGEHVAHKERGERYQRNEQVFTPDSAFTYGELLGARYQDNCVIWFLGGDHEPSDKTAAIWDAMGRGFKAGSHGAHLVSYHSSGARSSSPYFHNSEWLDFNTVQSVHRSADPNYLYVAADYALLPIKPTLDMESRYESMPEDLNRPRLVDSPTGRVDARQAREAAWWGVLAGGAGHGYGHNSVWQMHDPAKVDSTKDYSFPLNVPTMPWTAAMDSAGAFGVGYMRKLMELRPWYRMVPDQSVVAAGQREGEDHIQAARAVDGSFVVAYLPFGHTVVMRLDKVTGSTIKAHWYDPREGTFTQATEFPAGTGSALTSTNVREFVTPTSGDGNDWVLVLEDASRNYPVEW
jgi:hypothetical protein